MGWAQLSGRGVRVASCAQRLLIVRGTAIARATRIIITVAVNNFFLFIFAVDIGMSGFPYLRL